MNRDLPDKNQITLEDLDKVKDIRGGAGIPGKNTVTELKGIVAKLDKYGFERNNPRAVVEVTPTEYEALKDAVWELEAFCDDEDPDNAEPEMVDGLPKVSIGKLDISIRAYNCLKRENIRYISDFAGWDYEKLRSIRYCGDDAAKDIVLALAQYGVKLEGTPKLNTGNQSSNKKVGNLLETTCWIIDVLPNRVSEAGAKQYRNLEKILLHSEYLIKKHYNILLKLNCYYKFKMVDYEGSELGETDLNLLSEYVGHKPVYFLFANSLISVDPDDMHMTLYNPSYTVLTKVKQIAESEGMFLWKSGQ